MDAPGVAGRRTSSRGELAVIDPERMRLIDRVRLDGDFSYDAISPDGRTLYLIEYVDGRDYLRYDVRAYDLERDRLLPDPIVDPREPDEEMGGLPYDRLWTANGRWAYTLYASPKGHSFVHALDTVGRTAACIDLHMLEGEGNLDGYGLSFGAGGDELMVDGKDGDPVALIDASTFEAREPPDLPGAAAAVETETGASRMGDGAVGGDVRRDARLAPLAVRRPEAQSARVRRPGRPALAGHGTSGERGSS